LCSFPDWRRNGADAKERRREDFDEWASGDFVTWQSRLRGWEAAVQIVLPLAAVALGMAAFDIVEHFS
jgi:hypothetical protein